MSGKLVLKVSLSEGGMTQSFNTASEMRGRLVKIIDLVSFIL